ncbi:hypothetical protein JJB11_13275 [Ramlibacter ginsenosidimutans]|uniref:Protein kinase domain-containing protein n=1 Tax=Ramlibacter ginsenosidimutans TaxID=502333 RepID=A0A934WNC2_9BURK|nr:hypothetical protein [Ramlibacter ginsenosidimutans]MBK6007067.1 hypothetical protein [Ramlibacter ginsenosidimutans]
MSHGAVSPSFGRFQALQVVGHEAASTHYAAFDPELDRQVALITAPPGPDPAEEDRLAFRLPRMRHPNIVSVLAAGLQDDLAYVAAECLQTEPLSAFLARPGRMPFFQGLPVVLQLLSAIEHAQARRLVHAGIDVEHVQVTPGGQPKLPAAGWSLSADRHPNLEDAARIARAVLCGSCPPALRGALDEVLLRAEAPDPAARYQRAEEFILALLAAAGYPVGSSSAAVKVTAAAEPQRVEPAVRAEPVASAEPVEPVLLAEPVQSLQPVEPVLRAEPVAPAEPVEPVLLAEPVRPLDPVEPVLLAEPTQPTDPVLHANAVATRPVRHAARRPLRRRRTGHHVLAACLLAALFLPGWVGERVFEGNPRAPRSVETAALGASPASLVPPALAPAAAVKVAPASVAPAPVAPSPVALAPVAPARVPPAAEAPATVALASMTAPPVRASAVQPAPVEPAVQPAAVEPRAVQPSPVQPPALETAPRAPSHAAPSHHTARSTAHPVAVAPPSPAPKPVPSPAVRQQAPHARVLASAQPVRAGKAATTHVRAARPQPAPVVTAASGCPYDDLPVFRELCEARQCNRPELRNTRACARMQAEQRAALARLRGTPD